MHPANQKKDTIVPPFAISSMPLRSNKKPIIAQYT